MDQFIFNKKKSNISLTREELYMLSILVHYTTSETVFKFFRSKYCTIKNTNINKDIYDTVNKYYKKNHQHQECLLMINYYNINTSQRKFELGRLERENDDFKFTVIDEVLKNKILKELNVTSFNTYERDQYFKVLSIEDDEDYYLKEINSKCKKIRLKYYTWNDLNANNKPLHENLIDIIFDRENVFNLATSKSSNVYKLLDKDILTGLYRSALKTIGFISEDLDMERTVLHGDIGEFLMNYMVRKYIMQDNPDLYLLPKLVFKTDPNMPVHGNDGTFYNKLSKEIYYLEAKFYLNLNQALNRAIDSINKHNNNRDYNFINNNAEKLRNLANNQTADILYVDEYIEDNYIIFLMCADMYKIEDVRNIIETNIKLKALDVRDKLTIIVLPILNKNNFMNLFKEKSEEVREELK